MGEVFFDRPGSLRPLWGYGSRDSRPYRICGRESQASRMTPFFTVIFFLERDRVAGPCTTCPSVIEN